MITRCLSFQERIDKLRIEEVRNLYNFFDGEVTNEILDLSDDELFNELMNEVI